MKESNAGLQTRYMWDPGPHQQQHFAGRVQQALLIQFEASLTKNVKFAQ